MSKIPYLVIFILLFIAGNSILSLARTGHFLLAAAMALLVLILALFFTKGPESC